MKTTVLLMIALGCGLVAAVGAYQFIEQSGARAVSLRRVVIATAAIDINEPFSEKNIRVDTWPRDKVPPGAVDSLDALQDKFARVRMFNGEPVLADKVMGVDGISGAMKIPLGYRVVSVKATSETSVSNLVEPGDRVDVVVVIQNPQVQSNAVAKTILKAVRVFAVNRDMDRSQDETKSADSARTVSLLLQPEHVEKLMMAANLGEIRLALRSPDDSRVDPTAGCTVQQVLGLAGVADDVASDGMLASLNRDYSAAVPGDNGEPAWTMTLLTPHSSQTYRWSDLHELPEQDAASRGAAKPADEPEQSSPAGSDEAPAPAKKPVPLEVVRAAAVYGSAD
jgi:pilus assembly protein CpaB